MPQPRQLLFMIVTFLLGSLLGYWLVFTVLFFEDVLPHGGMW